MKKINFDFIVIILASVCITIIGAVASNMAYNSKEKDLRIAELERSLEVMEEANTSLKNENEMQQIMIDNLEYDLEQAK